jgi:hypothetical protein
MLGITGLSLLRAAGLNRSRRSPAITRIVVSVSIQPSQRRSVSVVERVTDGTAKQTRVELMGCDRRASCRAEPRPYVHARRLNALPV